MLTLEKLQEEISQDYPNLPKQVEEALANNGEGLPKKARQTLEKDASKMESVKGVKSTPKWYTVLFCTLMIIGLIWCVVYYLSPSGTWPIPNIGAWNLAIGFGMILIGFIMTMGWQ